ncbi:MAG: L-aspartate oxidase [Candidatus Zixiibacteriota bacterium]|nr:MAG: L-aspartate oxidase [candidate division Zixibacteria bacterium]
MERHYDFLVVGSGIAGLFYALEIIKLDPKARVAIVTKKAAENTNTNRAQGGIAAVLGGTDSFDSHIEDTLKAGCGLCNKEVVKKIVQAAPSAIAELVAYGVKFTKKDGQYSLAREGGHSASRVVRAADLTGKEIERALLTACRESSPRIDFFQNHIVLDLIVGQSQNHRVCSGAYIFTEKEREFDAFYAPVIMLATGGLGQVYYHTSNPKIATGDGVAIAHRAGVSVANLEFIQFHPTTLYSPERWPFLISEAVRGEGGRLMSIDGRSIMENAHELKDLAPRDIVARAIHKELKTSGKEYVLLDISHRDADFIKQRFPNIYKVCRRRGFDITKRPIPVVPAAHYSCGGVVAGIDGETELKGLYVAGEVAMTGMHGANRLASNSLLEAVVMAKRAAQVSCEYARKTDMSTIVPIYHGLASSLHYPSEKVLLAHNRRQLKRVMSDFVGIVRNEELLILALEKVKKIKTNIEHYYLATPATYDIIELRNMATVSELIIRSALMRKESRGLQFIENYPDTDDAYLGNTVIPGVSNMED